MIKPLIIKKENHNPKYFFIDANGKILGRLASQVANLLTGTLTSFPISNIDQGNFVIIINAEKILLSGKKQLTKMYYKNSQRPGSLKKINFLEISQKFPHMPIKKAVLGMLPKNKLQKKYINRLFIYTSNNESYNNIYPFLKKQNLWVL